MTMQDDLIKEFVVEAREHLAGMETDLLAIEEGGPILTRNWSTRSSGRPIPSREGAAFSG